MIEDGAPVKTLKSTMRYKSLRKFNRFSRKKYSIYRDYKLTLNFNEFLLEFLVFMNEIFIA